MLTDVRLRGMKPRDKLYREADAKGLCIEVCPSEERKAQRAARMEAATNTFEATAREWYALRSPVWAPSHAVGCYPVFTDGFK